MLNRWRSRGFSAILAAVSLSSCGSLPNPEPVTKTVEVKTAVPVSCVPSTLGPRPTYTDTDAALKAAPDFSIRYQLMASEHAHHFAKEDELWGIIDACRAGASK